MIAEIVQQQNQQMKKQLSDVSPDVNSSQRLKRQIDQFSQNLKSTDRQNEMDSPFTREMQFNRSSFLFNNYLNKGNQSFSEHQESNPYGSIKGDNDKLPLVERVMKTLSNMDDLMAIARETVAPGLNKEAVKDVSP